VAANKCDQKNRVLSREDIQTFVELQIQPIVDRQLEGQGLVSITRVDTPREEGDLEEFDDSSYTTNNSGTPKNQFFNNSTSNTSRAMNAGVKSPSSTSSTEVNSNIFTVNKTTTRLNARQMTEPNVLRANKDATVIDEEQEKSSSSWHAKNKLSLNKKKKQ